MEAARPLLPHGEASPDSSGEGMDPRAQWGGCQRICVHLQPIKERPVLQALHSEKCEYPRQTECPNLSARRSGRMKP